MCYDRGFGMVEDQSSASNARRGELVMLQKLDSGTRIRLRSGAIVEVTDNPRDGSWIYVRYLTAPGSIGAEELVFAEDVMELLSGE